MRKIDRENIAYHFATPTRKALDGLKLETSIDRVRALADSACLFCTHGRDAETVPNMNFTAGEQILWEMFVEAFRENIAE